MANETVLIVEDERDILNLISYNLRREGYKTKSALSGEEALALFAEEPPDIVVLDLMLPGIDGLDVCREMKQSERLQHIPIIMLTAKSEDADIVTGLEAGADDYVVKPFSPNVLVARVRAVLRRFRDLTPQTDGEYTRIHGIEIDIGRHRVRLDGEPVELSATEFVILSFLASNPGWVFTRSQIITSVHGEDYPVTERAVGVQILGIRKKLQEKGKCIVTVRGIGYKMEEERDPK